MSQDPTARAISAFRGSLSGVRRVFRDPVVEHRLAEGRGRARTARASRAANAALQGDRRRAPQGADGCRGPIARDQARDRGPRRLSAEQPRLAAGQRLMGEARGRVSERKDDPAQLQAFHQYRARARAGRRRAMSTKARSPLRAEPFGLNAVPAEVLALTAGADVQDDRVEISIVGWDSRFDGVRARPSGRFWQFPGRSAWGEVDELLRSRWRHPSVVRSRSTPRASIARTATITTR